jgi:hypothetical protein
VAPVFEPSSGKHGVSHSAIAHAIFHATFVQLLEEDDGSQVKLFIGPEHAQTDREIEVLVREFPGASRQASIFHAMPLGPKFARLREEVSNGQDK